MCRPWKWLWGLLPLALLVYAAVNYKTAPVEADLSQRATKAVAGEGQPWARIAIDGRDATVIGQSPNEQRRSIAAQTADRTLGVRLVRDAATALGVIKPYLWSAEFKGKSLVLAGHVPSDEVRAALIAQAKAAFPGVEIVDQMALAAGAPADAALTGAAGFAFAQLGKLSEGKATLTDLSLALEGKTASILGFNAVKGAVASLPAGLTLGGLNILPPAVKPYILGINHAGNTVTFTGFVPSDEARKALIDAARAKFPGASIVDNMRLGSGQPSHWAASSTFALAQLGGLTSGRLTLEDNSLKIDGDAASVAAKDAVLAALSKLPSGLTRQTASITAPQPVVEAPAPAPAPTPVVEAPVVPVPEVPVPEVPAPVLAAKKAADACQLAISDVMKGNTVHFRSSSADIKGESFELLNAVAEHLGKCIEAKIEISGHTDNIGSPGINQILSEERAQAVADYLTRRNVNRGRLSVVGHGESRPVAPNDTVEGRQQNRRIEFTVK